MYNRTMAWYMGIWVDEFRKQINIVFHTDRDTNFGLKSFNVLWFKWLFFSVFIFRWVIFVFYSPHGVFWPIPNPKNSGFNALCVMDGHVWYASVEEGDEYSICDFRFVN